MTLLKKKDLTQEEKLLLILFKENIVRNIIIILDQVNITNKIMCLDLAQNHRDGDKNKETQDSIVNQ
jgi:hypothetical protein